MNTLTNFLPFIINKLADKSIFLCTQIVAFTVILFIGSLLTINYLKKKNFIVNHIHTLYLLFFIILSMAIESFAWILKLSHEFGLLSFDYIHIQYITISAWIFNIYLYQALGLFIENIISNTFIFRWYQKVFLSSNIIISALLMYSGICHISKIESALSIHTMFRILPIYRPLLMVPSLIIALQTIYHNNIPTILKKQLDIFCKYIVFPLIISDIIQCFPFYSKLGAIADVTGAIAIICTSFTILAIIFCARNLIQYRLFNFTKKIQSFDISQTSFTGNFKDVLEHLSLATTPQEVVYITQMFFKENFQISNENICLNFRYKQETCTSGIDNYCSITSNIIESFLNKDEQIINLLREYKILVADEIAFDAYYNNSPDESTLAEFLNNINSEIFLPIYDKNSIVAYLTIKRGEYHKFYDLIDQNKIIIFGTYLASMINIMHNSNTSALIHENKKLKEELYLKHQEVNQYKESIKNLLKQKTNGQVGILFYKDDRFTIGNEAAQNIIAISLNQQRKHPITLALTKLAQQVESFRTLQSKFIYDLQNKKLLITGVPHLDYQGGVILTICHADTAEIIKNHIDKLKNPSQIDYLLYLETTKSGKFINQMIPSNHELLLNFKIQLLEIALHKKAALLQSHQDDLMSIVEIIHHISLRTNLHVLDLKPTMTSYDLAIKIFGLNPLLALENHNEGLLKKLDQKGTLFIKNIEYLDIETQVKLAHFIRYGIYTIIKSEHKVSADVRIICSINENPQILLEQNKLSPILYEELLETTIHMPSLLNMEEEDLYDLIDDFTQQSHENNQISSLFQISKKDKEDFLGNRPVSLQEFKFKLQNLLNQKTKDYQIFHETHIEQNQQASNHKLMKVANLGKFALKDKEVMTVLWNEFHCQNKIALFLGVNRSSVQRRCKEYNLM